MYSKEDPSTIQSMFDSVAERYDSTNAILSLWLHKRWNRQLVKQVLRNQPSHIYLDLCAGTGDIAFDYLKMTKSMCTAHLVDFSAGMLECAKVKGQSIDGHEIFYSQADVQSLPFAHQFADVATMAYGIRNVKESKKCLKDVFRVLKPGGTFGVLELTRPKHKVLKFGHSLYLRTFLPFFGKILTSNREAYEYLCNSIDRFISPEEVRLQFEEAGFINHAVIPLCGGIASIIIGHKPNE